MSPRGSWPRGGVRTRLPVVFRRTATASTHPEASAWATRVASNGGSVSASTLAAVSTFCSAIDSANLRNRFYRVNLFCGTGLNAALVPLYRGPSLGGTQYGGTTDTNVSGLFVTGDYDTASGLKGNGSSKALRTGLLPSDVGTGIHLAMSVSSDTTVNTFALGVDNAFDSGWTTSSIDFSTITPAVGGTSGLRARSALSSNSGSVSGSIFSASSAYRVLCSSARTVGAGQSLYENGTLSETRVPTYQTHPAFEFSVFGVNRKGTIAGYSPVRLSSYSIGLEMSATQASAYNAALSSLLIALGRPT